MYDFESLMCLISFRGGLEGQRPSSLARGVWGAAAPQVKPIRNQPEVAKMRNFRNIRKPTHYGNNANKKIKNWTHQGFGIVFFLFLRCVVHVLWDVVGSGWRVIFHREMRGG